MATSRVSDWRVLVIDDDRAFLEIITVTLARSGWRVTVSNDPREGLKEAITGKFDLILLDLMMPGMTGEEILSLLKPLSLRQRIVVISGADEEKARARVRDLGAAGYIQKPVNTRSLVAHLVEIVQLHASGQKATPILELTFLGRLATFVFDDEDPGRTKQVVAILVLVGECSILASLILF